jgi:hypothetical protein
VDGIDSASGICVLNTSDRASVNVVVNPMSHYDSQFVEVLGKVNNDLSISDMGVTNLGTNFGKLNSPKEINHCNVSHYAPKI